MAYRDFLLAPVDEPEPPVASPSDAHRFGLDVARMHVSPSARYPVGDVVSLIAESEFDVVILRYPAGRTGWFAELEQMSERTVLFGEAITVSQVGLPTDRPLGDVQPPLRFVVEREIEIDEVGELVEATFGEHQPHYVANPLLPGFSAPEAYGEWIAGLADNPRARVILWYVGEASEPAGFAAIECYEDPQGVTIGEIHIFGTRPGQRRLHEGMAGFFHVEATMAEMGATRCFTMVQAHNLGAATGLLHVDYRPVLVANTVHIVRHKAVHR